MENVTPPATPLQVLNGGVEIVVEHLTGEKETIKVRQIPLRLMPRYGMAQGDEGKLAELFVNKDEAWVDGITQESQEQIVEIGDRLNIDPFFRWSQRRLDNQTRLAPLAPQLAASRSPKSVPPSAPGAATPPSSSAT